MNEKEMYIYIIAGIVLLTIGMIGPHIYAMIPDPLKGPFQFIAFIILLFIAVFIAIGPRGGI